MTQISHLLHKHTPIRRSLFATIPLLLLLIAAGCGGERLPQCAQNESLVNGKCQILTCDASKNNCPTSTYCDTDNTCKLDKNVTCSKNSDCGSGTCVDNRCINPSYCKYNAMCMPGYECDAKFGICRPSVCPDGCRDGGICDISTKKCVSAQTCTQETESIRCIPGERCIGTPGNETCMTGTDYCNSYPCTRGQCNPSTFACESAANCYHNDSNCVSGEYCDGTVCKKSECGKNPQQACVGGGVCNPTTGSCENKNDCSSNDECLNGYTCIYTLPSSQTGRKGTCRLTGNTSDYCGTCPGSQTCTKKETNQWVCEEPAECSNAIDCTGDRICTSNSSTKTNTCKGPIFCKESHKGTTNAPQKLTNKGVSNITLCSGSDYYIYKSKAIHSDEVLVVSLDLDPRDIGLADVTLTVSSSDSAFPTQKVTLSKDGSKGTTVSISIPSTTPTNLLIQVESNGTEYQPVRYQLHVDTLNNDTAEVCQKAHALPLNGTATGNLDTNSTSIFPNCENQKEKEDLWYIDIPKEMTFTITVDGEPGFDPSISLRSACNPSEKALSCINNKPIGESESLTYALQKGRYYIAVQSRSDGHPHNYKVTTKTTAPLCHRGEKRCQNNGTNDVMEYCSDTLDHFDKITCTNGCSADGYCNEQLGLSCLAPQKVDINHPITAQEYTLEKQGSTLTLPNACGTVKPEHTTYTERVFAVTVPKGASIVADVTNNYSSGKYKYSQSRYVIYLLDDCLSPDKQCLSGSGSEDTKIKLQKLFWTNYGEERTVYLYIDGGPKGPYADPNPLKILVNIMVTQFSCTPNTLYCDGDQLMLCSEDGQSHTQYAQCEAGKCKTSGQLNNYCELPDGGKGDTCDTPIELLPTQHTYGPYQTRFGKDDYGYPQTTCGTVSPKSPKEGEERVFKVHANKKNDRLDIRLIPTPNTIDASIFVTDTCSPTMADDCIDGVDNTNSGEESISIVAEEDNKDYYFVVQSKGEGSYQLEFNYISEDAQCIESGKIVRGKIIACDQAGKLHYCDEFGHINEYPCDSCTTGENHCDTPKGFSCTDAFAVDTTTTSSDTITGNFKDIGDIHFYDHPGTVQGQCLFEKGNDYTSGERIYRFKVAANTTFTADFHLKTASKTYVTKAYLLKSCTNNVDDLKSCLSSKRNDNERLIYTTGASEEEIYLVLDAKEPIEKDHNYTISWKVEPLNTSSPLSCQPNTFTCTNKTSFTYCSEEGTSSTSKCPSTATCDSSICVIPEGNNDGNICANAITLSFDSSSSTPIPFKWNTQGLSNIESTTCSAVTGFLRYFKVDLQQGEKLIVKGGSTTGNAISTYITNSCYLNNTSCLAAQDGNTASNGTFNLHYTAPTTGTYYIAIGPTDGKAEDVYASFQRLSDCSADSQLGCQSDTLTYCLEGRINHMHCTNGCAKDSYSLQNLCTNGDGDSCFDATLLNDTTSPVTLNSQTIPTSGSKQSHIPYHYLLNTKAISDKQTAVSGVCLFKRQPTGNDKFYAIHLDKGEHLNVSVTSSNNGNLVFYMLDSCTKQTCIADDSTEKISSPKEIDFVAPTKNTYYLVVAELSPTKTDTTFSLTYSLEKSTNPLDSNSTTCTPFLSQCLDGALHICQSTGNKVSVSQCPADTTCASGACRIEHYESTSSAKGIDQCTDNNVVEVNQSARFDIAFNKLNNMRSGKLDCKEIKDLATTRASKTTDGTDAFFKVTIPAGHYLRVWAKGVSTLDSLIYYTYDSCQDTKCQVGSEYTFKKAFTYEKIATFLGETSTEKTFYIGFDSFDKDHFYPRSIYFEFFTPECFEIGSTQCVDATHSPDLKYCIKGGEYSSTTYTCASGSCKNDTCENPTGDDCHEPIPITFTPNTATDLQGNFATHQDTLSTSPGALQCTGSSTPGRDVIYSIKLKKGDVLSATVTGSGTRDSQDLAVYLTDTCGTHKVSQCLTGADKHGLDSTTPNATHPETIQYTATEEKTYYLVVDSFWQTLSSDYSLSVTVSRP